MQRRQWHLLAVLWIAMGLLALLMGSVTLAAPSQQEPTQPEEDGQEYVVQAGDWLSTISQEFLGRSSAYTLIVEATNAKAASDPRFTRIDDPDVIEVGQRLWIPAPSATVTATVTSTVTSTVTDSMTITATPTTTVEARAMMTTGVRFVAPVDGMVVMSPVMVAMEAAGIIIEPAGEIRENAGHFHILIDTDFVAPGELIPFDDHHRHFGQGQLTTTLELEPGIHTLRLQLANGAHFALDGEQYRDEITVTVTGDEAAAPAVRFVAPVDGAVVTSPVAVEMAAQGITIEPAGEIRENAGHFHILIDTDFVAPGELIPFDDRHRHFGQGQLTTTLELEPGIHTLRLQLADGAHFAREGDAYRDVITVTVQAGD